MKEEEHIRINEKKWDEWAKTLDNKSWRNQYLRSCQKEVISLLELKEGISLLDIGCGTGWALGEAARLIYDKGNFYGIDLSEKMIEKAIENFKGKENFHFISCNAISIPLEKNLFDIIICTNSFHHYLYPEKVLAEMKRLLRAGGRVYILDPTADGWVFKIIRAIIKRFEKSMVNLYSTEEFKELIRGAGFKYVGRVKVRMQQKVHIGEKQ